MSLLVITHDLPFVAEIAHEIVVLYAGQVVETGPPSRVLASPRHPYTQALVRSVPPADSFRKRGEKRAALPTIEGSLPDPRAFSRGCRFAPRCPDVMDRCREQAPPLFPSAHPPAAARCFLHESTARPQGGAA